MFYSKIATAFIMTAALLAATSPARAQPMAPEPTDAAKAKPGLLKQIGIYSNGDGRQAYNTLEAAAPGRCGGGGAGPHAPAPRQGPDPDDACLC